MVGLGLTDEPESIRMREFFQRGNALHNRGTAQAFRQLMPGSPMNPTVTAFEQSPDRGGGLGVYPNLAAYVARGQARPAFQRAFAAQLAFFTGRQPVGRERL